MQKNIVKHFKKILGFSLSQHLKVNVNYPIGKKTWFGVGGKVTVFIMINSLHCLTFLLRIIPRSIPLFIIGSGSNLMIRDGGYKGFILKLGTFFKTIELDSRNFVLEIGAGAKDLEVAKFCEENSVGGFEFLRGIPGTIGGNIRMNAGCFDSNISDSLISITIVNREGKIKSLKKEEIDFGYRNTSLDSTSIIIKARFKFKYKTQSQIRSKHKDIVRQKNLSQPSASKTGGSTFTNPLNGKAWKLIDKLGYRGKKFGGAMISSKHTNFIINHKNASALDIELLAEEIRQKTKNKFDINLNWEIKRIGRFKKI